VAASLVSFCLFRPHDGDPADDETPRRLAAEYRACYGVPLTLPEPAKGMTKADPDDNGCRAELSVPRLAAAAAA
jgi:hypothetical protein